MMEFRHLPAVVLYFSTTAMLLTASGFRGEISMAERVHTPLHHGQRECRKPILEFGLLGAEGGAADAGSFRFGPDHSGVWLASDGAIRQRSHAPGPAQLCEDAAHALGSDDGQPDAHGE